MRDVLPEVHELQACADGVGMREIGGGHGPVKMQQEPAYRIGGAPAVVEHVRIGRIAHRRDVLPERRKKVIEQFARQRVAGDRVGEAGEGVVRQPLARHGAVERVRHVVERDQALRGGCVPLVGDVVGGAREAVDGEHRLPQASRDEERGDGKVFVMGGGHGQRHITRRKDTFACRPRRCRWPVLWRVPPIFGYTSPFGESGCESGGIGRRTGFRFQRGSPWGFESPLSHHECNLARIRRTCKRASKHSASLNAASTWPFRSPRSKARSRSGWRGSRRTSRCPDSAPARCR